MDLIAIKKIGVPLPDQKNIDNCIKYNRFFSVAFARNNIITVLRKLTSDDYETLIDYYELTDNDPIMFSFQGYYDHDLGDMPLVISNNHKKVYDCKSFETDKPVISFSDNVLGVNKDEEAVDDFISNLSKFDRKNFPDISNLLFGDNLVAILNPDGEFETYGLELTSTKKWQKGKTGIIYSENDYNYKHSYNNGCYNSNSYYGYSGYEDDYDEYNYNYTDNNSAPYKCDSCKKNFTFVMCYNGMLLCKDCFNHQKTGHSK